MIGTGAEVPSHLINGPRPDMSRESEYIVVNDYSPSLVKVDTVESYCSASCTWIPGIQNPVTVVIILMVTTIMICGPLRCLFLEVDPKGRDLQLVFALFPTLHFRGINKTIPCNLPPSVYQQRTCGAGE